jgi:flagellar hook-associated protein 2
MVAVTGLGSGLDIDGLVAGLVGAERVPKEIRLNEREASATALISAFSSTKASLTEFEAIVASLAKPETFATSTASISDSTKATVTATSSAALGSYQLSVQNLASAQTLTSGTFSSTSDTLGTGTLTIALGSPTYAGTTPDTYTAFSQTSSVDITIDGSNNTLAGVRDAINASNANVTASILKNGDNYQLLLVSENTGAANSMSISVSGDGDATDTDNSGLSQLSYNGSNAHLTQSRAGGDAEFTLNGLSVVSSSNTVTDVIDGVTLTLQSQTTSDITLNVTNDAVGIIDQIQAFVDGYNDYATLTSGLVAYNAETGEAGVLQGDSTARSVSSQIRQDLSAQVSGLNASYTSLSDVGITVKRDGTLMLDSSKLLSAINQDLDAVAAVFSSTTYNGVAVTGIAASLETRLDAYLATGGVFSSRTDSLNDQLKQVATDREVLDKRMQAVEARYYRQLNAMDSLLAEIESTGNFLQQQFKAMQATNDY